MNRASLVNLIVLGRLASGWVCIVASCLLLALTLFTYTLQPDHFAAFTLMPIWVWCIIGLCAAIVGRVLAFSGLAWVPAILWIAIGLTASDESRALIHFWKQAPQPGPAHPHDGRDVIRVITANIDLQHAAELKRWQPDVVLLQDARPHHVHRIAREIFGENASFRTHETNGIITRWDIIAEHTTPGQRSHQTTIHIPEKKQTFKVVNVHLLSAATDLSLWRRGVWTEHRVNRAVRLDELERAVAGLKSTTRFPDGPAILGGDFNAPPGDTVYRTIETHFKDAHPAAGRRPGNTYHRRFPVLRIDRIHATSHFTPVRATTDVAPNSDHRFVIVDFVFTP